MTDQSFIRSVWFQSTEIGGDSASGKDYGYGTAHIVSAIILSWSCHPTRQKAD